MKEVDARLITQAKALVANDQQLLASLFQLRKKAGISQAVVAQRMGVTQPAIAALESHDSNPTLSTLRRYALAIGAKLTYAAESDDC